MYSKIKDRINSKKSKYSKYIFIIFIIILGFSLVESIRNVSKARDQVKEIEERIENLKWENNELETNLEKVKSDEYMESQLRDELGYVKEGEIVVVLPDDEDFIRSFAPKLPEDKERLPDPNWKKWVSLFM